MHVTTTAEVAGEAGLVASIVAFHVVDHQRVPEAWHPLTHLVAGLGALGAGRLLGLDADDLGLAPAAVGAGVRHGLVAAAVSAAAVAATASLPASRGAFGDPRAATGGRGRLARRVLVDIPVGTAVYEEAVFRGTLLGLARRRLGPRTAEAVVAMLFGAWHVLPALEDRNHNPMASRVPLLASVAPTVAGTTVAGFLLGRLRDRSGSLVAPILSHTATNVAGLLAARLVTRRRAQRAASPGSPTVGSEVVAHDGVGSPAR